jgi:NAD(P)-dependent dehydrogenase (short-subunit alcohol dehydrogenase family)
MATKARKTTTRKRATGTKKTKAKAAKAARADGRAHGGANQPDDPKKARRKSLEGAPPKQQQKWPGSDARLRPQADHGEESYRGSGKLEGKRALITGGDSGIGRAVAIAFAREGADVAIVHHSEPEDARETLHLIGEAGRHGVAFQLDLADADACRDAVERTVEELGGLDIVVNNAAYQKEVEDFGELTTEQIERTFRVNILAYIYVAQAALEHLDAGGTIINTGSVTGLEGHASLIDYSATKGAIHTLTKSLAQALSDRGIRVNCVAPGPVWTPLIAATLTKEHVGSFGEDTFWGRPAQPAEIAPSFVFLASDDGRYYTGDVFAPTGRGASR